MATTENTAATVVDPIEGGRGVPYSSSVAIEVPGITERADIAEVIAYFASDVAPRSPGPRWSWTAERSGRPNDAHG